MPAAFVVNTTADTADINVGDGLAQDVNGDTSLLAAVMEGRASQDTHIEISFNLPASSDITVFQSMPSLNKDFSILGPTGEHLRIKANGPGYRIFHIEAGAFVEISDVILENADISAEVLEPGRGAAIYNEGDAILAEVDVNNNKAYQGGAIYNSGNLEIIDATVMNNEAFHAGGGIYNSGYLDLESVGIYNNTATFSGGGIYNRPSGTVIIADSQVSFNQAVLSGGGIKNLGTLYMDFSEMVGNFTTDVNGNGTGGGLYSQGTTTINNSDISSNSSNKGGGVYVYSGTTTIADSTMSLNTASVPMGGDGVCWWPGATLMLVNPIAITDAIERDPDAPPPP